MPRQHEGDGAGLAGAEPELPADRADQPLGERDGRIVDASADCPRVETRVLTNEIRLRGLNHSRTHEGGFRTYRS
jgi:hypothetical protein